MRVRALFIIFTAAAVALPSIEANAKSCLLDAAKASEAVWPKGVLKDGRTLTGRHPCGKLLRCIGDTRRGGRTCKWL